MVCKLVASELPGESPRVRFLLSPPGTSHGVPMLEHMEGDMDALAEVVGRIESVGGKNALANALGFSHDTVLRVRKGGRGLSTSELQRVADSIGTSVHWLLTGQRDPNEVVFAGRGCRPQ